jgi:hypothetical protein
MYEVMKVGIMYITHAQEANHEVMYEVMKVGVMYITHAEEAVGLLDGFVWRGPQWRQPSFGHGERVDALVQSWGCWSWTVVQWGRVDALVQSWGCWVLDLATLTLSRRWLLRGYAWRHGLVHQQKDGSGSLNNTPDYSHENSEMHGYSIGLTRPVVHFTQKHYSFFKN